MVRRHRSETDRGVSEVIAVLLMVAVTIVLAAMVGSVLLGVVTDVEDNPIAGASVTFDGESDEIRVVFAAAQKSGTTIDVKVIDESTDSEISGSPKSITDVGEARTFDSSDGLSNGGEYTVRIVAKAPDGKQAVVMEKDGSL